MYRAHAANFYKGDLAYIFKEEALLNYPFPFFKDEKFAPELLVWNDIAEKDHIAYFYQKLIYLCQYLPERYAARLTSNLKGNPTSFKFFISRSCIECLRRLASLSIVFGCFSVCTFPL